ncbi:MAG: hypothetical protein U0441_15640 [Polyangiaceae bacterium]
MTMPSPMGGWPPGQPASPSATVPGAPAAPPPPEGPPPGDAFAPAPAIAPPPPKAQKSKATSIALGSVIALLVVGGGTMGYLLLTGGKKFDSRIPLDHAPPVTVAVMSGPAHGDLAPSDGATKEASTSALAARFCGGMDVVGELFAARYRDAASAVAALAPLRDPVSLTDGLKCGKVLAEAMDGRQIVQIGLVEGQTQRRVAAIRHKAPLPPFMGFVEKSFANQLGRCAAPREGQKAAAGSPCAENGAAGFDDGSVYYGGRVDDLSFFAVGYRPSGGNRTEGEAAGTLADLTKKLDPADSWELRYRPESIDLSLPCVAAAPADGIADLLKLCLPPGHEADGVALAGDVKASAVLRDRPEQGRAVGFEYVLWARDSESARAAETKLNAYVDAWSKTVTANETGILKILGAGKDPRDAAFRTVARTWIGALKKPEVKSSGDIVRLIVRKPLLDDDKAQIKNVVLATSEDVQKAGVIVDALLDAKPAPTDALAHFLGADLTGWLLASNATVTDCRAIAKHANDMSNASDFPMDQFLPMTELIETWGGAVPENEKDEIKIDEKACTQRRLPTEAKTCLLGAKTIGEMNKCPVPTSPDVASFRARIQGAWKMSGGVSSDVWGNKTGGPTTFKVAGPTAELSGGYDTAKGELGFLFVRTSIIPEMGGEVIVARIRIGDRRAELVFAGDKLFLATWDKGKKKPAIQLERVTDSK